MGIHVQTLLQADSIGRRASRGGAWLIQDVSLAILAGSRTALIGPSGSGKSVLLRALALLDPLDAGTVLWRGRAPGRDAIPRFRARVIYLHQRPALADGSVLENLQQPLSFGVHQQRTFDVGRIERWLAVLQRDPSFLNKRSRDLSGGERQITALLRAMQLDPEVLLLDEPTAALDQAAAEAVAQCVQQWFGEQPAGRSYLVVSHNRAQVRRMVDQEIRIEGGRLV